MGKRRNSSRRRRNIRRRRNSRRRRISRRRRSSNNNLIGGKALATICGLHWNHGTHTLGRVLQPSAATSGCLATGLTTTTTTRISI